LKVASLEIGDGSTVFSGDALPVGILVENSGPANADASTLLLHVPGAADAELNVPALASGQSAWVNSSVVAPSSGVHLINATVDAYNIVQEASESDNRGSAELVVSTRMDLSFKDDLTVTSQPGDLEGPWTVEGVLV
jgi:subtilase family serine protease